VSRRSTGGYEAWEYFFWRMDAWGEMAVNGDWRFDGQLSDQINSMSRGQRHMAAYLALRRLQEPLLEIEMPADWGVDWETSFPWSVKDPCGWTVLPMSAPSAFGSWRSMREFAH
jgi:hypothetical protein